MINHNLGWCNWVSVVVILNVILSQLLKGYYALEIHDYAIIAIHDYILIISKPQCKFSLRIILAYL